MNGPPSNRFSAAQSAPPLERKLLSAQVVKIVLPAPGTDAQIAVTAEGGKPLPLAFRGMLAKRFRPGEREGYFRTELYEDGILEIGDRVTPKTPW